MLNSEFTRSNGIVIAIFIVVSLSVYAASEKSETRQLSDFTAVEMSGHSSVEITEGDNFQVIVRGRGDRISEAETTVKGKTLVLGTRDDRWQRWFGFWRGDKFHFDVTMPRIDGVSVSGSGSVYVKALTTQALTVSLTGSGDIKLEAATAKTVSLDIMGSGDITIEQLEAIEVNAEIVGSGNIHLSGAVHQQYVDIMGSGDFNGKALSTEIAKGAISGSGDIKLGSAKQSSFNVSGSGEVDIGSAAH